MYVREGLDRILPAYDRDIAGSCGIGNGNYISINDEHFLHNRVALTFLTMALPSKALQFVTAWALQVATLSHVPPPSPPQKKSTYISSFCAAST
jgi:hypothetical protein